VRSQFRLEQVDITQHEHLRRLYGMEIPVFFLEGQFLMKNFADLELTRQRLRRFYEERSEL